MKLLRLRAQNFRSFERFDLDLNVDGLVAVVGPNGAGKSTIFGALEWGLYGARGRGTLPVRRDGCPDGESCWVEVHFEVGGRAYGVCRVDGKDATLVDLPTGESLCTGRDETSRRVATLLGLTRDMFRGTFYARQREVQALDSDNEVKRRAQVELLLGIERLRRAAAHAATSVKEQKHLVKTLEDGAPDLDSLRAETARIESEAQQAAPIVQVAEAHLEQAKTAREQAKAHLGALRAQEREMIERRARVQAATSTACQERAARDALSVQVTESEAADAELAQAAPLADRVESLAAQEREMDLKRANHERAAELRAVQHRALSDAAGLSNQMVALVEANSGAERSEDATGEASTLEAQIEADERELESLRSAVQEFVTRRQAAERRAGELREQIARGERAALLDSQLAGLPAVELAAEDALNQWHAAQARRTQLDEAIRHDMEHRQAVLSGETQAACPTCRRVYDTGELEDIVAGYDRDLQAAREQLEDIDAELVKLKTASTEVRGRTDVLRALSADRRAIVDVPKEDAMPGLRDEVSELDKELVNLADQENGAQAQLAALSEQIPRLRAYAREAEAARRRFVELDARRAQAENEARLYAEQLSSVGANGYEADAHVRLRTELVEAQAAGQRCAALRAKAGGLELLRRRLAEQEAKVTAADIEQTKLVEAVDEVAVELSALQAADEECATRDKEFDAAYAALLEANRQASSDSEAVAAAHARLQDGRERTTQLRRQRRELRLRSEIADALSAYREDASRRARPTLEHETGLLLGHTTRQRYSAVQLTDSYQLEDRRRSSDPSAAAFLRRRAGSRRPVSASGAIAHARSSARRRDRFRTSRRGVR